jgi:Family of unknown function (DUF5995)
LSEIIEETFADLHRRHVTQFKGLYDAVTKEIEQYRDNAENGLSEHEREWLTTLILGFRERFETWIPEETKYLQTLYGQTDEPFTLPCHAYLHIAYDLPLVIAATLQPRAGSNAPVVNKDRARQIFFSMTGAFKNAMNSDWPKPMMVALLQLRALDAEGLFLNWIALLRAGAWNSACDLAHARETDRPTLRRKLHQQIYETLKNARAHSRIWGKIFALVPPDPIAMWSGAATIALALGAAALGWESIGLAAVSVGLLPVFQHILKRTYARKLAKLYRTLSPPSRQR